MCVGCVGCVWGAWDVRETCMGCTWSGWVRACERVLLSPLYYPDTLVNLDTCLGVMHYYVCAKQKSL